MSSLALIALAVGALLLLAVMLAVLAWDSRTPETEPIEDPIQRQIWDERAHEAAKDYGLAAVRGIGGKWAQSVAAILGALSAVAIVAGPDALAEDVGGTEAIVAAALVLLGGGLAALALLLAALAEQGTPVEGDVSGPAYRTHTRDRARKAARQVVASRSLTVLALLCVVAAAGVAWLSALTGEEQESPQFAIVVGDSEAACGALTKVGDDVALSLDGEVQALPANARVTLVDSCP